MRIVLIDSIHFFMILFSFPLSTKIMSVNFISLWIIFHVIKLIAYKKRKNGLKPLKWNDAHFLSIRNKLTFNYSMVLACKQISLA